MKTYYVDEAMMGGDEWESGALLKFVDLLNDELAGTGIVAEAVTDSYNGAENDNDLIDGTEAAWSRALERS
jgi:hypothetical protein